MGFFKLTVDVINGELKEFPETFYFKCNKAVPVGNAIIRFFTDDMQQVAHKTFYIRYGLDLFGSNQFVTINDFYNFLNSVCPCCTTPCYLIYNVCNLSYNNCNLTYKTQSVGM